MKHNLMYYIHFNLFSLYAENIIKSSPYKRNLLYIYVILFFILSSIIYVWLAIWIYMTNCSCILDIKNEGFQSQFKRSMYEIVDVCW